MMVLAAPSVLCTATVSRARAQQSCSGLESGATRAEQAECWFRLHRTRATECGGPESASCAANAADWCRGIEPGDQHVANLCLLAFVAARRFDDAQAIASQVRDVAQETAACHRAFTEGLRTRVVAVGPGPIEVRVDERVYGAPPIEVTLRSPWWRHTIEVRFGDGRIAQRGSDAIAALFDPATCTIDDVTVDGGAASDGGGSSSVPAMGLALTIGGGVVAAVGGVVLLLAELDAADLRDDTMGAMWSSDHQSRYDALDPMRVVGGVTLAVGLGAAAVGITWMLLDGGSQSRRATGARPTIAFGSRQWMLRWSF